LVYRKNGNTYLYNDFQSKGTVDALEFSGKSLLLWEGSRKLWEVRAWEGKFRNDLYLF
jgi:hypothetical protein